jgi:hypothetical protein
MAFFPPGHEDDLRPRYPPIKPNSRIYPERPGTFEFVKFENEPAFLIGQERIRLVSRLETSIFGRFCRNALVATANPGSLKEPAA